MDFDLKKISSIFKDKKNKNILIAIACLILLVIAVNFLSAKTNTPTGQQSQNTSSGVVNEPFDGENFEKTLEKRVADILSQIEGVGKVEVFVTVESGAEYEYATYAKSKSEYKDDISYNERDESYLVIKHSSGDETPVLLKKTQPDIKGILVVCQGGDDPKIRLTIIEAMKATFNIGANKIYVAKK